MSSNKDYGAAQRIKSAALSAAKGLSRAQAERAAAAAVRNVNAYGQKEEGPSRWQERKEAKRQMYLMSTEKPVRLGERKDNKSSTSTAGSASQCQKCFQTGHWTYECKNERAYISRPSRSQQMKNQKLKMPFMDSYDVEDPDIQKDIMKEEKIQKREKKSKRKHKTDTESDNDSEASVFESDSETSSVTGSDDSSGESESSDSSSIDSEEERRRKRKNKRQKQRKRRHRKYSSSSESSESYSESDSDSEDNRSSRRKNRSRRHVRGH